MIVHLTAVLHTDAPPEEIERQGDHLMLALLRLEAEDSNVRDAAVSADLGERTLEVEVLAEAPNYDKATYMARQRVAEAVRMATGHPLEIRQRHSELVSA